MPKVNLTNLIVQRATSKGKAQLDYNDTDCRGLALRVTSTGKKTWTFRFDAPRGGKRPRITLGTYSEAFPLSLARTTAHAKRKLVGDGQNPRDVANEARAAVTMAMLIDDYIRLHVRPDGDNFLRTCMDVERRLDKNVIPLVGTVPVKDFRMMHLKRVTNPIMERNAPSEANHVFSDLRHMMSWAVKQGVYDIEFDPIAVADKPGKEKKGERWLTLDEIRTLWRAAPGVFVRSHHVPTILRIMIATGQRPGEVCGMHRDEIDFSRLVWTIPAGRSKNGFAHEVPLNNLAWGLVTDALRETNGDLLFTTNEGDAFSNDVLARCVSRAFATTKAQPVARLAGMAKFTPHALRHSVTTNMSLKANGLGISRMDAGHVLNHRSTTHADVTSIYDQNPFLDEKREALRKWGELLERVIAGETIVHLDMAQAA